MLLGTYSQEALLVTRGAGDGHSPADIKVFLAVKFFQFQCRIYVQYWLG